MSLEAKPISTHDWSATTIIYIGNTGAIVLKEIVDALQANRVKLQVHHAEEGLYKYRVIIDPLSPLYDQAADVLMYS